jgi:hypothetical protein
MPSAAPDAPVPTEVTVAPAEPANMSVGAAPSPAKASAPAALKPKPKLRVQESTKETVSSGNMPSVEQTLSKKVVEQKEETSGVVVAINFLAAAAAIAFAFLLYKIFALPI